MKEYLVSFGDSDKYSIKFDGNISDFENSAEFKKIEDAIFGYVKSQFPDQTFKSLIGPTVEYAPAGIHGYEDLTPENLEKLEKDVKRQMEVRMGYSELDMNAPFDKI